jgi:Transposase DDE domain
MSAIDSGRRSASPTPWSRPVVRANGYRFARRWWWGGWWPRVVSAPVGRGCKVAGQYSGRPIRAAWNALYRAPEVLFSYKEALEKPLSQAARDLFSLPERLCFFDLSNSYFEGKAAGNGQAKRGHSKEKRSDAALIIDEQGFPKYSRLYPGNQWEAKTLVEMIEGLIKARPELARDRTVIIDAGIGTEENIQTLRQKRFHYICVSRTLAEVVPEDTDDCRSLARTPERL